MGDIRWTIHVLSICILFFVIYFTWLLDGDAPQAVEWFVHCLIYICHLITCLLFIVDDNIYPSPLSLYRCGPHITLYHTYNSLNKTRTERISFVNINVFSWPALFIRLHCGIPYFYVSVKARERVLATEVTVTYWLNWYINTKCKTARNSVKVL